MKETEILFKKLQKSGINFTPYLEIGSEYALRASLLESKFAACGFATDISLYSLSKAAQFARLYKFKKVPKTLCADAYNLPFKSNSFPFVFVYETLHHFPDPKPILIEAKRVLAPGGLLLVGADPIAQTFQIRLWRRPNKLRVWEKILKSLLILPFISHIGKTEVDHGIIEEAFSLRVWQNALSVFDSVEAKIKAFPFGPTETIRKLKNESWSSISLKTRAVLHLLGGGLEAICQKANSPAQKTLFSNLDDLLICPNCLKRFKTENGLRKAIRGFNCPKCQIFYQTHRGVLVLLEKKLEIAMISLPQK
ncbi:hypothetical protein A2Z23_00645 [Candidatus Curtissbacteria bacterium RBG_16_39_7]|uniref:Methyltransferase type 11 domain-containing protein n=1 Tax=Candidatus Curtissbacteria bacterium RBG_16_39_7 TaxID=1797707 RepID=A0A1F5G3N5_9BACT|nr:MAG: hypothetical protein A2Z23_00645 [Candidatus Curtissbacteria bacterium RBG_16_39_7]